MNRRVARTAAGLVFAVGLAAARADTLTWTGMTGDWHAVQNWTNTTQADATRVPTDGDDAVIDQAGAYVSLTNASAFLGSLTLGNASLVMSNWDTLLSATNVTIASGGILTCDGPFTNGTAATNRVNLLCSNLLVESGGAIDVNGKGWAGGYNPAASWALGHGPGALLYLGPWRRRWIPEAADTRGAKPAAGAAAAAARYASWPTAWW